MTKGYNVFINDKYVEFIEGRNLKTTKAYIKSHLLSTHMGEWRRDLTIRPENIRKTCYEYTYSTTIGRYYRFQPAKG